MASEILTHAEVASHIDMLSAWIEAQMAYNGQPGISIGVVYDQELVWARGFGYANVEQKRAAMPQTIYRIASITKLFTSTAILQLRDAGKLQLDDPITRHLSWFNIQNRYADAERKPLVEHLADFRAGLLAKGDTAKHADLSRTRVRTLAGVSGIERLSELEPSRIQSGLAPGLASASSSSPQNCPVVHGSC